MAHYLEKFDQYPEFQTLLPSYDAVQEALSQTIDQVSDAVDTFEYATFLERRESFYQAYREIFECISQVKEYLGVPDAPTNQCLPASSPPALEGQASSTLTQISESVTQIWRDFRYEPDRLHEFSQKRLLGFEKELRAILAKIATSQDLKDLLWEADQVQVRLRETVLQLNFAADILDLPLTPERSRMFSAAYKTIRDSLSLVRSNLRSKA